MLQRGGGERHARTAFACMFGVSLSPVNTLPNVLAASLNGGPNKIWGNKQLRPMLAFKVSALTTRFLGAEDGKRDGWMGYQSCE